MTCARWRHSAALLRSSRRVSLSAVKISAMAQRSRSRKTTSFAPSAIRPIARACAARTLASPDEIWSCRYVSLAPYECMASPLQGNEKFRYPPGRAEARLGGNTDCLSDYLWERLQMSYRL